MLSQLYIQLVVIDKLTHKDGKVIYLYESLTMQVPLCKIILMRAIILFMIDHVKLFKRWASKSIHTYKLAMDDEMIDLNVLAICLIWINGMGDTLGGFGSVFYLISLRDKS